MQSNTKEKNTANQTIDKIHAKVVLREFRNLRSACARYKLVN
jgi:hypothetical protein